MVMLIVTIGSNVNWYIIITNAEHELLIEGSASAPDDVCYYIFIMERSDTTRRSRLNRRRNVVTDSSRRSRDLLLL